MNERMPFDASQHGRLEALPDGRLQVVFERELKHSPEKVWRALTDAQELENWFPGLKLDQRQGGRFSIWFGGECEGPAHVEGIVDVFDPPHVLQLGSMRTELTATPSGCRLRFTDILHFDGSRTKPHHALLVLPGWERYVDNIAAHLDGGAIDHRRPETDYRQITVPGWHLLKD